MPGHTIFEAAANLSHEYRIPVIHFPGKESVELFVFGDEVMVGAAALIDRLVHHCHIVTIRGNSYRMRQHTELWHALHATPDPEPAPTRRRRTRQEVATT